MRLELHPLRVSRSSLSIVLYGVVLIDLFSRVFSACHLYHASSSSSYTVAYMGADF